MGLVNVSFANINLADIVPSDLEEKMTGHLR